MSQAGDVTVISTMSIQNSANAAIIRAQEASGGFSTVADHATRDALPSNCTTLGTLVRTLNDGTVWEVTSVGPVVWTIWIGSSSAVNSVFGRTGTVAAVAGDYPASKINNDSATVSGTHVSDALDALKALNGTFAFQAISNLISFNATGVTNGTLASVATPDDVYELLTSPSSAVIAGTDGVNIIQSTTPNTVRWVRKGLQYSYVSDWYVDPVGGNDTNDGSIGAQLKTSEELCKRLFPGGQQREFKLTTVNVHIAAGTVGKIWINATWPASVSIAGASFNVYGSVSQSLITLSTVVVTVPAISGGTRGQVSTSAGTFVNKQRIQSPPNALLTFSGGLTYSNGLNSGVTNSFVKEWMDPNDGHITTIANGASASLDVLQTTAKSLAAHAEGNGYVLIQDLILNEVEYCHARESSINNPLIFIYGCEFPVGGRYSHVDADVLGCRNTGAITFEGGVPEFYGHAFQADVLFTKSCFAQLRSSNSVDAGCAFTLNLNSSVLQVNFVEFENCDNTKTAITVSSGCRWISENITWGTTTSYALGFAISGGAHAVVSAQANLGLPSATNIKLVGQSFSFAQVPVAINADDCSFSLETDSTGQSTVANKIVATLADVQSATNVIASPAPGPQYTAKAYLEILVAGTLGKLLVNEIHTGPSGTVITTPITAPIDITTVGSAGQGIVTLAVNGSSAVQYSVTSAPGTFTKGSLSYKLFISITPEPI